MRKAIFLCTALVSGGAQAALLIESGESLTLNTPSGNLRMEEGSRLHVGTFGAVLGTTEAGQRAAVHAFNDPYGTTGGTKILVNGFGAVIGGANQNGIFLDETIHTRVSLRDHAFVSRGIGATAAISSVDGITMSLDMGEHALVNGNIVWDGYIDMSGQSTVVGGLFDEDGQMRITMADDSAVTGLVSMRSAGVYTLKMKDNASIGDGIYLGSGSTLDLDMQDGYIANGIESDGGAFRGDIYGGRVDGGFLADRQGRDVLDVYGGAFDLTAPGWLIDWTQFPGGGGDPSGLTPSVFSIYGGQWGYGSYGSGFRFGGATNFDVYGLDLSYAGGWLSGHLGDGSWINVPLTFSSDWVGAFNIYRYDARVPEPGTLGLLGFGLTMAWVASRRRRETEKAA